MSEEIIEQTSSINDFIPDKWKHQSVLLTAYRVINCSDQLIDKNHIITDFPDLRVMWVMGGISYRKFIEDFDYGENDRNLKLSLKESDVSKKGNWLFFFQLYDQSTEFETKNRLSSYCGIYLAINGLGNAIDLEFQHILHSDNKISYFGNVFLNPSALKNVDLSASVLSLIKMIGEKVAELDPSKSRRLMLALHWFEKSMRARGTDSFLNAWIALEALAMPDTTDISSIKKKLSKIFEVEQKVIEDKFCIGRMFGLRSKIVHDGLVYSASSILMDHIHAIFTDLLIEECGLQPIFRSKSILNDETFSISDLINI